MPLRGSLIPVPAQPQDGVCSICHSSASHGYPTCAPCSDATWVDPPEIVPITMSVDRELIHHYLRGYKDDPSSPARNRMVLRLAALLAVFLAKHGDCIGEWDYVTCVPSTRRRPPGLTAVVECVPSLSGHSPEVLEARPGAVGRVVDPTHFTVSGDVRGHRILLLDDTFVSGAKLFSATAALRQGGATVVAPLVIGRHIRRDWPPSRELLSWLEQRPWLEDRCSRCAGERR